MYIVDKGRRGFINLENVTNIHVGGDEISIKVNFINGSGTQIANYATSAEAYTALEMIYEKIGKNDVIYVPSSDEVKTRIINTKKDDFYKHSPTGKKAKGHGGS